MAKTLRELQGAVDKRTFDEKTCFLCSEPFTANSGPTVEDVIPKWLQHRYNLWNEKLILLNGSSIPYRLLKIPSCASCNNSDLSRIESRVKLAVELGPSAVRSLDPRDIFSWLGKIFYGLMYRELFLLSDIRDKSSEPILSPMFLERFRAHHLFLQAARYPFEFMDFFPGSVFVFDTIVPSGTDGRFDLRDNIPGMSIAIRMGDVGIVACLQDGGAQLQIRDDLVELSGQLPLHPLQFREVAAQLFYGATLLNRIPKYLMREESDRIVVNQMPLAGLSANPVFDPWVKVHYANLLAVILGCQLEDVFRPPDQVMTLLKNSDGTNKALSLVDCPWPQ